MKIDLERLKHALSAQTYKNDLVSNNLIATKLKRGVVWLDAGTTKSLLQASQFVQTIQERQQIQIACPEEIAFHKNWINSQQLEELAVSMMKMHVEIVGVTVWKKKEKNQER